MELLVDVRISPYIPTLDKQKVKRIGRLEYFSRLPIIVAKELPQEHS
jgi:hypothetical protein